ncbi:MAG: hypothetical protein COU31_02260, partial [Candidatus Magasanikbacteria bacterium CG10_big_fil_rev_8_21_14_0_10_40_10]
MKYEVKMFCDMNQETYSHIREKIIDYLSRQGFSERKLFKKVTDLRKRYPSTARYAGYIGSNVQQVINDLKLEGVINDESYARDVLRQLKNKKDGPECIRQKLYCRLIPKETIELVMAEFSQSGFSQDFVSIIRETRRKKDELRKKLGTGKKAGYVLFQKLYAFLAQKGYYPDDISKIIEQSGKAHGVKPESDD